MKVSRSPIRGSLALALLSCWSCRPAPDAPGRELAVWQGQTMGTTFTVKVAGPALSEQEQTRARDAIEAQLARVNELMSTYLPSSELSRFNQWAGSEPFALSAETWEVFQVARSATARSM
jgi:thiamine biosynthesis lipoprotein